MKLFPKPNLKFGMLARSNMMCKNMKITVVFRQALSKIEYYTLNELKLQRVDKHNNELMPLRKVD
jgi:hypothetical protein